MRKGKFSITLVLGIALVAISFSMMLALQIRGHIGAGKSRSTLEKMEALLPERYAGIPEAYSSLEMPVLQIDGEDYAALLEIPSLSVALPIADKWNSDRLPDAPARFYGSVYDHTLVIGGTDHPRQFAFCDTVDQETVIVVTDMTGAQFTYKVAYVDRAKNAEYQWLTGTDYDLTLYCRDTYSMEYLAVRCKFAYP